MNWAILAVILARRVLKVAHVRTGWGSKWDGSSSSESSSRLKQWSVVFQQGPKQEVGTCLNRSWRSWYSSLSVTTDSTSDAVHARIVSKFMVNLFCSRNMTLTRVRPTCIVASADTGTDGIIWSSLGGVSDI